MAIFSEFELQNHLKKIIEHQLTMRVKPDSSLSAFNLNDDEMIDLCFELENLGFDFEETYSYFMANDNKTISDLANYLFLNEN